MLKQLKGLLLRLIRHRFQCQTSQSVVVRSNAAADRRSVAAASGSQRDGAKEQMFLHGISQQNAYRALWMASTSAPARARCTAGEFPACTGVYIAAICCEVEATDCRCTILMAEVDDKNCLISMHIECWHHLN